MDDSEAFAIGAFLLALLGIIILVVVWTTTHECKRSHIEKQWQMPPGVVVGGGKNGGGISIPVGNAREVEVTVCDEYGPKE